MRILPFVLAFAAAALVTLQIGSNVRLKEAGTVTAWAPSHTVTPNASPRPIVTTGANSAAIP